MRFHDGKLKLVKALLFRSFHETEAPAVVFICGRAYGGLHDIILNNSSIIKAFKLSFGCGMQ